MGILGLNKKERSIWNSIEIGNKVEFTLKNKERYKSTVSGIDYTNIYIKTPTVGNAFLDFPQKMPVEIELEVHHPRRARVKFVSKILGQEWLKENCIKIACPHKIGWVELRWHYRIEVTLNATFSFVEEDEVGLHVLHPAFMAIIKNISEGGALLVVDKLMSIAVGSLINMKIQLLPQTLLRTRAKVIHIESSKGKYGLGIEWVIIGEKDKEDLRRFIADNIKNKS